MGVSAADSAALPPQAPSLAGESLVESLGWQGKMPQRKAHYQAFPLFAIAVVAVDGGGVETKQDVKLLF